MADTNNLPIDPFAAPPSADTHDLALPGLPPSLEPTPQWPPPSGLEGTSEPPRRARVRAVIFAVLAAMLLTATGVLAVVARQQASARLSLQRTLSTASNQLNVASQDLSSSSSEIATTQSSLADAQARVQQDDDALAQVEAAEVDAIAPYLVDGTTTPDEARCIVKGVIDDLGVSQVLRYDSASPSAQLPPELERAILQAASQCVPGATTPTSSTTSSATGRTTATTTDTTAASTVKPC